MAEIAADGSVAKEYIYLEGEPLAILVDGQLYYYHNSHLGTPLLLSDAQQQVVWQAEYSAFGKAEVQVATIENNLRFPGQYFDEETGLHYNYFRDYDPQTGRYLQSDPIGLAGGINTYGYVLGNPVRYVDPFGLSPAIVCLAPPVTGICIAGASAVGKGVTAIGAAGIGLWAVLNKSAESKPEGCPTGTLPIDKAKGKFDLDKDDVHKIKDGIGAGPRDWTGISPDGRVWGGDGRGGAIDFGPLDIYIR